MPRLPRPITILALAALLYSAPSRAEELLFNGNFETGTLDGWTQSTIKGGFSFVAGQGSCFSANNTTGLRLGGTFAAGLRPSAAAPKDSVAVLTSDAFEAGDGIMFKALSETVRGRTSTVAFEVHLLDENLNTLFFQALRTNIADLTPGCPSADPRNAAFSTHFVSTKPYAGQTVRLQFRQSTQIAGLGLFTLIDDVTKFAAGEMPLFDTQPVAVAGTSMIDDEILPLQQISLDGSDSFDPGGDDLTFRWYVNGETVPREGATVAVDDLAAGNHTAVLMVTDGVHIATDTLRFVVPADASTATPDTTDTMTTTDGGS